MQDNINNQFFTQFLLEDIDETSVTSGGEAYQRKKGERTTGGMIYKDLWAEGEEGIDEVFTKVDYQKARDLLKKLENQDPKLYDAILDIVRRSAIDPYSYEDYDSIAARVPKELGLTENYSKFKNETKTRGKADQFHQAIREVKRKVQEIDKVFEYVNRLKNDLNEGESGLKYKKHTEAAIYKIKEMVNELNSKIKKFK